jgi:hypothetical protein
LREKAVDEAMTFWHAEMALNLEATIAPMWSLFLALSTNKDKQGSVMLQEVAQLKEGLLQLRQRTSGIFDKGSGALDKRIWAKRRPLTTLSSQSIL